MHVAKIRYLALLRGDGGVPVDESGENSSQGLDTKGERSDIQQNNMLHISS